MINYLIKMYRDFLDRTIIIDELMTYALYYNENI